MTIKPILHRVLVKPDGLYEDPIFKKARQAGLAMPDSESIRMEENRMDTGVIVDMGSSAFSAYMREADLTECPIKIGDKVSFARHAGKVIMDGDTRYIVMNDEDVVAVLGGKDE